jgi:hypothetical protein
MRCQVYNENTTVSSRPGVTLLATSSTTTLPASIGWARFQFSSPYTPSSIGEVFWLVFDNTAAAPATDFPLVRTATGISLPTQSFFAPHSSTAGFSTTGTRLIQMPGFIIQGGATRGVTLTSGGTPVATNPRARGVVFSPPVDCTIELIEYQTGPGATANNVKIWDSSQLPNATPIYQFATGQTGRASSEISGIISFEPPFVARKNKTYYICLDFTSNSTTPTSLITDDYSTYSTMIDNNVDNFTLLPLVRDNGSNVFVVENQYSPRLQLILGDLTNPTITVGY